MRHVTNGDSGVVLAMMCPSGLMIQPPPPHLPDGSTRLDDALNAPERTAATTPAENHLASVLRDVARGASMTWTPRAA
ncbi:hypothetical protein BH09GEM1_BH09GEM1_34470 [soil metagenome]